VNADTIVGSYEDASGTGMGFLLGAGYAIPVSEESRVMLSFNVSNKDIDGENWSAASFNIGGLW
jgi:hypothetical protein